MDAIMFALVAVLLANADGRSGIALGRLIAARPDRRVTAGIAFGAFLANAIVAALAGSIANRMVGPGIADLFVALALLSAAGALLWPMKAETAGRLADAPAAGLAARMLARQFGDRSHFLIGALAATSGAGQWAAAGGLVGWTLAMLPFLAFGPALAARRAARLTRWAAAAILALWGIRTALGAFGLIG
jgi:putative Ca2+/H+ antiporter (TMEM165/GDT1 family)